MILTHDIILEEIKQGAIQVEPFDETAVGPGSIDLRLGTSFRRFTHQNEVYRVTDQANFEDITEVVEVPADGSLMIKPGETVLGITVEKVSLPSDMCGWIEGRSRFARIGLGVHITSGFAQPGVSNQTVLEITNLGPTPLALLPGVRICQFIFERAEGSAQYQGRFQGQNRP